MGGVPRQRHRAINPVLYRGQIADKPQEASPGLPDIAGLSGKSWRLGSESRLQAVPMGKAANPDTTPPKGGTPNRSCFRSLLARRGCSLNVRWISCPALVRFLNL